MVCELYLGKTGLNICGNSPGAQWSRPYFPLQRVQVQSLLQELRFHMRGHKKKKLVERKKERISLGDARESVNSKANLNGNITQQGI